MNIDDRVARNEASDALHDHVLHLEQRIQALSDCLTEPSYTAAARIHIESEIREAELGLVRCRQASELARENARRFSRAIQSSRPLL